MMLEKPPDWWDFELELSPHLEDRMIDRGFSEADLRLLSKSRRTSASARRPGAGSCGRVTSVKLGMWWSSRMSWIG
jgi:hypothetical protein